MAYLRLRRLMELAVLDRPGLARVVRPRGAPPAPAPAETWDTHHTDGTYQMLTAPERRQHHHLLAGMIADRRPNPRVLEVGCGQGAFYQSLRRLSPAAYLGADISPVAIAQAEAAFADDIAAGRARFTVADGLAGEGAYDAIVIADCLEYLGSPAQVLERCAARLAPGGVVAVTQWLAHHPLKLWREVQTHAQVLDEAVLLAPWGGAWQVWTCRPHGVSSEGVPSEAGHA
jgi:SAM-dependent methyltransferase